MLGFPWRTGWLVWVTGSAGAENRSNHHLGALEEILVASHGFMENSKTDVLVIFWGCRRLCRMDLACSYSMEELSKAWKLLFKRC